MWRFGGTEALGPMFRLTGDVARYSIQSTSGSSEVSPAVCSAIDSIQSESSPVLPSFTENQTLSSHIILVGYGVLCACV